MVPRNPLSWLAVALAVVGAGCQFDPRGNGASVVFDSDGGSPSFDGGSRADAAPGCVPSCTAASNLDTCAGETDCPLGCIADNTGPRCGEMVPSNGALAVHLAGVTTALDIAEGGEVVIETDTGRISGAFSRNPAQGVESGIGFYELGSAKVAVLAVASLRIGSGAVLRGVGYNALIVLSAGDVEIRGKIDFSAWCTSLGWACGGPGAGDGGYRASFTTHDATGCGAGGNGQYYTGGGGGALGANGGAGGALPMLITVGGTGGSASGCPGSNLAPLVGGSGGGVGGLGFDGVGGGGGGAVQLTSFTQIGVQGTPGSSPVGIECSGAGGREGGNGSGNSRSGGGGGAGGAILLEAPRVIVALARLTANGGGGGAVSNEGNGEAGGFSSASANGGGSSEFAGGAGGALSGPTGLPGTDRGSGMATGGGGGSAGIIHVRTAGGGPMLDMVTISPAHTTSSLVVR